MSCVATGGPGLGSPCLTHIKGYGALFAQVGAAAAENTTTEVFASSTFQYPRAAERQSGEYTLVTGLKLWILLVRCYE